MPTYAVVNKTGKDVKESKPTMGEFMIPKGGRLVCKDIIAETKVPETGQTLSYIKYTAKEVAESIIRDYQQSGLELEVSDETRDGKVIAASRVGPNPNVADKPTTPEVVKGTAEKKEEERKEEARKEEERLKKALDERKK